MFTQLITETLLGALTGYITNDTAIRSLFKPDGVIEKTRDDFAREAGRLLESQVLTPAVLKHQLMLPEVQAELAQALERFLYKELPDAFQDMTLQDLPEHKTSIAYLQQILLRFAASEKDALLHYLKKYVPAEDILTPVQCKKLADTLEQLLLDSLQEEQFAEKLWQSWLDEKGTCTLHELQLAPFCSAVASNLAYYSTRWLAELETQYSEQLKEAALQSIQQLDLEPVLKALDQQMESYTLRQYLNCTVEELSDALYTLLHAESGARLLDAVTAEVLTAMETIDIPIQQLIPADLLDDVVPVLQQKLPAILEELLQWIWQNRQSVQRMLEETVDEIAMETGGMKGMLLEQLKDSLLSELMQSSDIYRTLIELITGDEQTDDTVDWLMHKLTATLTENTVGQLVYQLNRTGRLQVMARQFLYENLNRYLSQAGSTHLEQLLDCKPGSLHLARHTDTVEQLLVQILLIAVDRADIPALAVSGCETMVTKPIQQLLQVDNDTVTEIAAQLVHRACISAGESLPQISSDTAYGALYDTIVWWLEQHGAESMETLCAQVSLPDLLQFAAGKLDRYTPVMIDTLSSAGLEMMQGRLSILAEQQIRSLSSAEMLELVQDFMGRELQPLNYLGAGMGAAAGATVGMALSTAVPAVSMANPLLAAGVLAGKTAVFGAVGYTTNCAAVKGLFWPYEPVAGIRTIQGVIPKQKERFAGSMGRLVDHYVINDTILEQQIAQLYDIVETQHTADALAGDTQLFRRLFAELAMERRRLTEPLCDMVCTSGAQQGKELLLSFGDTPLTAAEQILSVKNDEALTQLYELLSRWITDEIHKEIPLDTLIDAQTLWKLMEKLLAGISLPDISGMAQQFLYSEHTLVQLAGEQYQSANDALRYHITQYMAQQKTQAQLAAMLQELLNGEKLYHWLEQNSDIWVKDNLTMLFHWVESLILEFVQSRQESLTAAIEQEILNRMGLMMQMGYAMMNGGDMVAAMVDRLLHQKLPIFLSIKRRELEAMLYQIWQDNMAPAAHNLAAAYLQKDNTFFTHTALRTLLAQPAVQQCAVTICADVWQLAAETPMARWGKYLNIQDLLARPQMQLGFQWQTHSKEIIACWQYPLQAFCADKLHNVTLAQLCNGYQEQLPLGILIDGVGINDTIKSFAAELGRTISKTLLHNWLYWDDISTVLAEDMAALLTQQSFREWMQHEAEMIVLTVTEDADALLPTACRAVLIERGLDAVFAVAGHHGTALLGKMQLSALAEEQLKQMDSAHLELVVRGFAQQYLTHIENRGWLGAVFALPGMLLYLI